MTSLRPDQRLVRLDAGIAELANWLIREHVDLDGWRFDGAPIELGAPWPDPDGVHVLSLPETDVPDGWPLEEACLELAVGGESLLLIRYADGRPEGFGIDPNHVRFPFRERRFALEVEATPRLPFGVPNSDPRLETARAVRRDEPVEALHRRLRVVLEACRSLGSHDVVASLVRAAERALAGLDLPSATDAYLDRVAETHDMRSLWAPPRGFDPHPPALSEDERDRVRAATDGLGAELDELRRRFPPRGAVAVVGQSHIDLAWLWPFEETRRKGRRTFWTAVGLLDRYPELRFVQSSAQLYDVVEADDPELMERVRAKVEAGTWEPVGGMWVECDANMPSGESFVRQLLYGQRSFRERFGVRHGVCWLPDCFGFSPALPQILLGAGIASFLTIKLTWSETNRFPHDLFWWEGLDGSRVLAHVFDNPAGGINGEMGPEAVLGTWRNYRGKEDSPETLLAIGFGDGGGGPTEEMVLRAREVAGLPALPEVRFTSVHDFFERTRRTVEGVALPTWVGELYLELHRGTLTSQGRLKRLHRGAERDLIAAEAVAALDRLLGGEEPASSADAWKVVLRNEFHDVLPGSSIREVNETAERELDEVRRGAGDALDERLGAMAARLVRPGDADGLLVVNPHLTDQPMRVASAVELSGSQPVEDGHVLSGADLVAGLEIRVLLRPEPAGTIHVSDHEVANDLIRVRLGDDGTLESIYDRLAGREVLDGRGNQVWVYGDRPRMFDAWDVDPDYADEGVELVPSAELDVVERGPHRAAIRIERRYRDSRIRQDVRLWSNSARIEFHTRFDWHERRRLVKARFPLAVRSATATFETAFGVVERPTHRNTSWDAARFEVPAHRFADLSEPGYGVALLNDGRYGYHALGNELGISLLRSPAYPDPLADEGEQAVTYALLPHRGDWFEGGVLAEADDLNRPLLARRVSAGADAAWRPVRLEGLPVALGALKGLEDGGGLVLRTYEPRGARGDVRPFLEPGWIADAELDLLEDEVGPPGVAFSPFRIHSWRLRRSG